MEYLYKCLKCNKEMFVKYGSGKFCSRSCANSRNHSEETKIKISKSAAKTFKGLSKYEPRYCIECNKIISKRNETGYCYSCNLTSPALKERRIKAGKKGYETSKANGTHCGWQTRNISSYAEKFFVKILNVNNIKFLREFVVRKEDGINNYFLDFYIEINNIKLDLEIDGKQHTYQERIKSDLIRDKYLSSLGYTIYRITWNEIKSIKGKQLMKEKISQFIDFYNNLQK